MAAHQLLHFAVCSCQIVLWPLELKSNFVAIEKTALLKGSSLTRNCAGNIEPVLQNGISHVSIVSYRNGGASAVASLRGRLCL